MTNNEDLSARFLRLEALLKNSTGDMPSGTVKDIEGRGVINSLGVNLLL